MTNIIPFTFENHTIRNVIDDKGTPWFVLADVCEALEIKNSRDVARRLDDDERADVEIFDTSSTGADQRRRMTVVSESGLYFVILRCQGATRRGSLPHRFRKWVTSEVLPAIRRTGGYTATETSPAAAGGGADFQVTIPFHHYNDLLQSLIQKQEKIATLEAELGRRAFTGVARVLIQETSLSDEEIARRMEGILGDYLPEWVAWQRRRLQGSRLS